MAKIGAVEVALSRWDLEHALKVLGQLEALESDKDVEVLVTIRIEIGYGKYESYEKVTFPDEE